MELFGQARTKNAYTVGNGLVAKRIDVCKLYCITSAEGKISTKSTTASKDGNAIPEIGEFNVSVAAFVGLSLAVAAALVLSIAVILFAGYEKISRMGKKHKYFILKY